MTEDEARYYLQSSGFSEEQIDTIEQAFKQGSCGDCVSRQAALECFTWTNDKADVWNRIKELPPVNPQRKMGQWIWQTEDIYRCSECGNDIRVKEVMNIPQYVRCPMREAKMVEPESEAQE